MRLTMILKSELNPRNKITAIRELGVRVLRYCFGIINWRLEEIKIYSKTNKTGSECTVYIKKHTTEARSFSHCCAKKAISIIQYILSVCL
jgi:hypothetical protein